MKKLIQIIYISRSTFESTEVANIIEPNVARILAKSRINNRKNGLVGVLYFGDGVFFQCLEGEEEAVNTLLAKLEDDPRHKDLKVISKKYIKQLSFGNWAMKFAPLDEQITKFLRVNGFKSFDPYLFSGEVINKFLDQLITVQDSTSDIKRPYSLNSTQIKSNLALIFSIVSLILSVLTFLSSHNQL
jgi:hypothetical protein